MRGGGRDERGDEQELSKLVHEALWSAADRPAQETQLLITIPPLLLKTFIFYD